MTNSEIEQLQAFLARADSLFAGGFLVTDTVEVKVPFRSGVRKKKQAAPGSGSWINDRLRTKLIVLREFYNGGQSFNFNRICNLVYRRIEDNDKKVKFASIREQYSAIFRRLTLPDQIVLRLRSEFNSPQSSLDIWHHWVRMHVDQGRHDDELIWQDLVKKVGQQRLEFVVYNTTYELAKCVKLVKEFVETEYARQIARRSGA